MANRIAILLSCVSLLLASWAVASDGPNGESALQSAGQDPVSSFKQLVDLAYDRPELLNIYQIPSSRKWVKQSLSLGSPKYDVLKTESLLHPVKGVVSFPMTVRLTEAFDSREEAERSSTFRPRPITYLMNGEYFLTDGAWSLNQFSYRVSFGTEVVDAVDVLTREKIVADINSGTAMGVVLRSWVR